MTQVKTAPRVINSERDFPVVDDPWYKLPPLWTTFLLIVLLLDDLVVIDPVSDSLVVNGPVIDGPFHYCWWQYLS